jgi:prepilin-type processing-associated H-X9-DG protein
MSKKENSPEVIEDVDLDEASGGGLLLPAVQKVRDAASTSSTASTHSGGANVSFGDGSVR